MFNHKEYIDILKELYVHNLKITVEMNLNKMKELDTALDYPSRGFKSIHVTGTNGKGSTAWKVSKCLEYSGYKVGLYTSPQISCFRERISINSEMISEERFTMLARRVMNVANTLGDCSFFEITTTIAYLYFKEEQVDVSVIEVGCGGRLDATNIINSELSIITSIGLDHQGILGNTIDEIAYEKAGIIKENKPVIIGPECPIQVFQNVADTHHSSLFICHEKGKTYEETNNNIVKLAIDTINSLHLFSISKDSYLKGIAYQPICRCEYLEIQRFNKINKVLLDVGHNQLAVQNFISSLLYKYPNYKYKFICGYSADKNISQCLDCFLNIIPIECISTIQSAHPRGMKAIEIKEILHQLCISKNIPWNDSYVSCDSIPITINKQLQELKENELLIIDGSLYIMAQVRYALGIQEPIDLDIYKDHDIEHTYSYDFNQDIQTIMMYPHEKPMKWR